MVEKYLTAGVMVMLVKWTVALNIMVGIALCAAHAGARVNLLTNGGFEAGFNEKGIPHGWNAYGGGAENTRLAMSKIAHSGKCALLISDHNPTAEVGISQTAPLPKGARFLIASVWVRALPSGRGIGGFIQLRFLPSNKFVQTGLRGNATEWQRYTIAGRAPDGTKSIVLYLYTHRSTICDTLVDDVEVKVVESPEELLREMGAVDLSAFPPPPIERLKDLCIDTEIVRDGEPCAAIVIPENGRYDALAGKIADAVVELTGAKLPIIRDSQLHELIRKAKREHREPSLWTPLEIALRKLFTCNLVILGNRSTNAVMEHLYNFYYTYLDLKYPGTGGYLVRSLHNPFGNGVNAILVGGSDDAGVAKAVDELIAIMRRAVKGKSLALGWTMRIKLGAELKLNLPKSANECGAWEDSVAYSPATYFGWNSVSRNMALYYMTGDEKFAREFLRLAFPDETAIREIWRVDGERIEDKQHPLSGPYHYNAHMMILLWDLIEESPIFTDEQRLRITRAFAEQLKHWQAEWCYAGRQYGNPNVTVGTRHDQYAALSLYCLARYFCKYYPHIIWKKNLEAARWHFASLERTIQVAGELDHLWWLNTGLEPLMSYMLISGDRRALDSGVLHSLLRAYDAIISCERNEAHLRCQSLSFAHKAVYLTGDGRFIYYRDLTDLNLSAFRIGQSFFPPKGMVRKPIELANRITIAPMSVETWRGRNLPMRYEEAFQFLSYRTGVTASDDYILVDGFYGGVRNPYHCLAISKLRIGDKTLLLGYLNQVIARHGGLTEPTIPMAAALKVRKVVGDVAHIECEVPNFSYGVWRRRIVHVTRRFTLVIDELSPRTDMDDLEAVVQWELATKSHATDDGRIEFKVKGARATIVP
ncbi:MAG TPA: hypothetical protein EYP10_05690 [Armatimonadetes bacterium]|nr:hypothetical protein [Armatimonadota bacterium]